MKVIFLDVDGVLNIMSDSYRTFASLDNHIEPHLVQRLNYLIDKTDAKIVVSSSWRGNMEDLIDQLNLSGFTHEDSIIGSTGFKERWRGQQILAWIKENNPLDYIILEDEIVDVCGEYCNVIPKHKVVEIDMKSGITDDDAKMAIDKLGIKRG